MTFELDKYLEKIKLAKPAPTAEGLAKLQKAQLSAIAFENIDPLRKVLPNLEPSALCRKILNDGRGGYCLELNGLFGLALEALGFRFEPILARVRMGRAQGGPRSHLAFLVNIEKTLWLADAGFGGPGASKPLLLNCEQIQLIDHDVFRLKNDAETGETVVEKYHDNDWMALYGFDRAQVQHCDLEAANVLCSTRSQYQFSPFPESLVMSRHTERGRIQLFNRTFTETRGYRQSKRTIDTVDNLKATIENDFGIIVSASDLSHVAWQLHFHGYEAVS